MKYLFSTAMILSSLASFASVAADTNTLVVKTLSIELADKLAQSAIKAITVVDRAG